MIIICVLLKNTRQKMSVSTKMLLHVEKVILLSQLKQKPDDYINVTIELDDVDITSADK